MTTDIHIQHIAKAVLVGLILWFTCILQAQTLHLPVGNVDYLIPASADEMTFNGAELTALGKTYDLSAAGTMYVDDITFTASTVQVTYSSTGAHVYVAGDVAKFLTIRISGAHVAILQSEDVAQEITYTLSGSSANGSFYTDGSYKCTVVLNGLTLTNPDSAAVNIHNGKRINLSISGTNTLTDGTGGAQKACLNIKGHPELTGSGTLNVTGNTAHAIRAKEYMLLKDSFTGSLVVNSAVTDGVHVGQYMEVRNGTITVKAAGDEGIQVEQKTDDNDRIIVEDENTGDLYLKGGTITVATSAKGSKGIKVAGLMTADESYNPLSVSVTNTGSNNSTSSGGGWGWGGGSSASGGGAKGIKVTGALTINAGNIYSYAANHEAIESKSTITINGGTVYAQSSDDAINAASHFTINGGQVCAYSTGNDGLDANGNCYIKGGLVYAIGSRSPEMAVDANTEGGYKLYVSGGTLVAVGSLERGASLTQSCYQASGSTNTWYAITVGSDCFAFKTPSSNASTLVVSGASKPALYKSVTPSGTTIFNGMGYYPATYSGGTSVSLSTYSASSGGGPGGGGRW